MNKDVIVFAIKDIDTGLFFNQAHRDFRPLAQNTLFCVNMTQCSRLTDPLKISWEMRQIMRNKNLEYVKLKITELVNE